MLFFEIVSGVVRVSDCLDILDVVGEMLDVQFDHIEDGDADIFLPWTLQQSRFFTRAGDVFDQVHDVTAIGAVQRQG